MTFEDRLKAKALALGFDLAGITTAVEPETYAAFVDWLAHGYAGEMNYLERQASARATPDSILAGVRSVVMVAMNYKSPASAPPDAGRIASYALGTDYHRVLWDRLDQLLAWVRMEFPKCQGRGVVDTAPLLERDFARRAGLGWFGKNTMLIHPRLGSYFFLGALLLDLQLSPDPPFTRTHCGNCTACLDACPTQAFPQAGLLDSTRCISYLTIEHRSAIPLELRDAMGDWIFGCDICQEVCPWNRKAPSAHEPAFAARPSIDLFELLRLTPDAFVLLFKDTALHRTKRRGLLRNVCIALGNLGNPAAIPHLQAALADEEPLVQEAAAWALQKLPTRPPAHDRG